MDINMMCVMSKLAFSSHIIVVSDLHAIAITNVGA